MSFDRRGDQKSGRELDEDTAEDLLAGVWRDPRAATHPVAGLLAAATAPPSDQELDGEDAAVAAFRDAQRVPHRPKGRHWSVRRALLEIATAKALIALAVAGTAAGGAALAASTGHLPVLNSPPRSQAPPSATATTGTKDATPAPGPGQPRRSLPGTSPAPGSPNSSALADLCRTYQGGGKKGRAKKPTASPTLSASEFAQLTAAAGGPDKVAHYCTKTLAGEKQKKKPADPPKKNPKETGKEKKKEKPGKKKDQKPKKQGKPKKSEKNSRG